MIRIVKLTFKPEDLKLFLAHFETVKQIVNNFEGCNGMQMLQDIQNPTICFTYSDWDEEADLERYRKSEAFTEIWNTIKPWFGARPEAWSTLSKFNGFLDK